MYDYFSSFHILSPSQGKKFLKIVVVLLNFSYAFVIFSVADGILQLLPSPMGKRHEFIYVNISKQNTNVKFTTKKMNTLRYICKTLEFYNFSTFVACERSQIFCEHIFMYFLGHSVWFCSYTMHIVLELWKRYEYQRKC